MISVVSQATAILSSTQMRGITRSFARDSRIISCYLDGNQKVSQWRQFISQEIANLGQQGHRIPGKTIETLYSLISQNQLKESGDQIRSLTIFISANAEHPAHRVIPIYRSMDNHFELYRKPNLLPLIHSTDAIDSSVLLALVSGSVRVYDIVNGTFKSVGWAHAPNIHTAPQDKRGDRIEQSTVSRRLKRVCMALLKRRYKPMILAAPLSELSALKNWLPRQLSWTVQNEIEIPAHSDWPDTIKHIKRTVENQCKSEALRLVEQIVNSMRAKGNVAIGPVSTMRALSENRLEKLVIEQQPSLAGVSCHACGDLAIGKASRCLNCGSPQLELWDPYVEATYLAIARGIPVVPVESESLRYLGGIGGLLSHPLNTARSPAPPLAQGDAYRLAAA